MSDRRELRIEHAPMCEECDEPMNRYTDPRTGKGGWGCDLCGWTEDDRELTSEMVWPE